VGAHQNLQLPITRKNTAQFFWELAGVAGCKVTPLPPATPANFQKNWTIFFLAVGVGVSHVLKWLVEDPDVYRRDAVTGAPMLTAV
jgi:hypothetical protein